MQIVTLMPFFEWHSRLRLLQFRLRAPRQQVPHQQPVLQWATKMFQQLLGHSGV
jgi:hypothetical protein